MNHRKFSKFPIAVCLASFVLLAGCHKKVVAPPPPPPPAPKPAPTANITVTPLAIDSGQSATLAWTTTNATAASISGIGDVATSGSESVTPASSTTYTLTARGDGGSVMANTRVTVNPPPPVPKPTAAPSLTEEQMFEQNVHDVFFNYDKSTLRSEDVAVAQHDAEFLVQHPGMKLIIEGHCDERGSAEYNIALGQERAESLQKALVINGVPSSSIRVISYGKERPFCTASNEQCWQQNRTDHLRLDR